MLEKKDDIDINLDRQQITAIQKRLENFEALLNKHSEFNPIEKENLKQLIDVVKNANYLTPGDNSILIPVHAILCAHYGMPGLSDAEFIQSQISLLNQLKQQYRKTTMKYHAMHLIGISIGGSGICSFLAAGLIASLAGFPAGLAIFVTLLVIGSIGLLIGGGLLMKGKLDNDEKFAEEHWKPIQSFINVISKSEVQLALQKANTEIENSPVPPINSEEAFDAGTYHPPIISTHRVSSDTSENSKSPVPDATSRIQNPTLIQQ